MTSASPETVQTIAHAVALIKKSHRTVTLTGAGISTSSGIPDFRSPLIGLWNRYEPMEVASLSAFRHNPEKFYAWLRPLAVQMVAAQPNCAHQALADLQNQGFISAIITQNIDGLLTRAGATNVLEVHGSMQTMSCTNCYRQFLSSLFIDSYIAHGTIPTCQVCGSILKPDVILYDEQLPVKTWHKAEEATQECDLMLVAGTSLEVMPSARLPIQALNHGAGLIIVNNGETFLDVRADVVIHADVAEVLPAIAYEVIHAG